MAGFFKSQDRLSKKSSFEQAYFGTLKVKFQELAIMSAPLTGRLLE